MEVAKLVQSTQNRNSVIFLKYTKKKEWQILFCSIVMQNIQIFYGVQSCSLLLVFHKVRNFSSLSYIIVVRTFYNSCHFILFQVCIICTSNKRTTSTVKIIGTAVVLLILFENLFSCFQRKVFQAVLLITFLEIFESCRSFLRDKFIKQIYQIENLLCCKNF